MKIHIIGEQFLSDVYRDMLSNIVEVLLHLRAFLLVIINYING